MVGILRIDDCQDDVALRWQRCRPSIRLRQEIRKAASFAMFGKIFLYPRNADHPWIVHLGKNDAQSGMQPRQQICKVHGVDFNSINQAHTVADIVDLNVRRYFDSHQ